MSDSRRVYSRAGSEAYFSGAFTVWRMKRTVMQARDEPVGWQLIIGRESASPFPMRLQPGPAHQFDEAGFRQV